MITWWPAWPSRSASGSQTSLEILDRGPNAGKGLVPAQNSYSQAVGLHPLEPEQRPDDGGTRPLRRQPGRAGNRILVGDRQFAQLHSQRPQCPRHALFQRGRP